VGGTACLTPVICSAALALLLGWRISAALLRLATLGVLLWLPFPLGLRVVAQEAATLVPWACCLVRHCCRWRSAGMR
jgi:hypothetical protein